MKQKDEFFQFGTTITLDPGEDIGVLLDEGPQWWQELLIKRKVIHIKGLNVETPVEKVSRFCQYFGTAWTADDYEIFTGERTHVDTAGIAYTTYDLDDYGSLNVPQNEDKTFYGFMPWHSDIAFEPGIEPYPSRALWAKDVRGYKGGGTQFIDLETVYESIHDPVVKTFWDNCEFEYHSFNSLLAGTRLAKVNNTEWRPAVRVNPESGRRFLGVNSKGWIKNARDARGWRMPSDLLTLLNKAKLLLDKQPTIFNCPWSNGDMVIWSNIATLHRRDRMWVTEPDNFSRVFNRWSMVNPFTSKI